MIPSSAAPLLFLIGIVLGMLIVNWDHRTRAKQQAKINEETKEYLNWITEIKKDW